MAWEVPLRERLRDALTGAMRGRDRVAAATLRTTLAAIDNAEAVDTAGLAAGGPAIEQSPVGVGAAEVERRRLTAAEIEQIVRAELAERQDAAEQYDRLGQVEHAERLRAEAAVLAALLV